MPVHSDRCNARRSARCSCPFQLPIALPATLESPAVYSNTEKGLSVVIPREDFQEGRVPNVCPQSGLLALGGMSIAATKFGIPRVMGSVYLHAQVKKAMLRMAYVVAAVNLVVLIGIALTFFLFRDNLILLVVSMVAASVVVYANANFPRSWSRFRVNKNGDVVVTPVARDFYDAMALRPVKCDGCADGSCCSK